jgi:small conductance mechanosensitive channel
MPASLTALTSATAIVVITYILHYFYVDTSVPFEEKSILGILDSWALSVPIKRIIMRTRLTNDEDLAYLIGKIVSGGLYAMGGLSMLGTLGVDTSPLVAGIGITGFTIGFALKEIATNFLSGMLLVLDKPFHKGQYLKVLSTIASMEGTVESIDSRYIRLRTKDGNVVMVPSSIVYSSPIMVGSDDVDLKAPSKGVGERKDK